MSISEDGAPIFFDALTAHDAYLRSILTIAWWPKRARGMTREHILQRPLAVDVVWREIGLGPPLPVTLCGRQPPAMGVRTEMRHPSHHLDRTLACEICLEQWQLEESRKMMSRVFAEFGRSLVPRPTTFITSLNV